MTLRQTTESCALCEKIVVSVLSSKPVVSLLSLPNTMNAQTGEYEWRRHGNAAYALVPRSIAGTTGMIDCYLCCDEDDLDDISILEVAGSLLHTLVERHWTTLTSVTCAPPSLAEPRDIACWKVRHRSNEENF